MAARQQRIPIILQGGLNLSSSVKELGAGECIQLFNYEVNTLGRYQRMIGFERVDGAPAPSEVDVTALVGYPFADDATEAAAIATERDARRTAIGLIPGSGPIRGVAYYNNKHYAFRDNAGGTACVMWESTPSTSWQTVTTPVLSPGGRYEFVIGNFWASSGTIELFGVDGINQPFRFDGTTFTQYAGPIAGKEPIHLEILPSQTMILAYSGGTFVYSKIGDPTDYTPASGGGEIGVGDEIVALDLQANNALAIFCRNRTYMLYGTSEADFQLQNLSKSTGAIEWSVQTIGDSIYLDDRGLTRLNRVQQFGNFEMATVSQKVEPLIQEYAKRVTASFVVKQKNQYRLCFDDGTGLCVTFFGAEVSGFSTFDYGHVVRCAFSGEDGSGNEIILFGSDDGYVYQAEKGFSFDGEPIQFACRPAFTDLGAPEIKKRWRAAVIQADTVSESTLTLAPDFDYSSAEQPTHGTTEVTVLGGGGYFDEANWDESRWNAANTYVEKVYIDGVSENISLGIIGDIANEPPHILNSFILIFTPKGRIR